MVDQLKTTIIAELRGMLKDSGYTHGPRYMEQVYTSYIKRKYKLTLQEACDIVAAIV